MQALVCSNFCFQSCLLKNFYQKKKNTASAGHRKFFFKSADPQPNFNFLKPQLQDRMWTFKSLVHNRKSATTFRDS